MLTLVRESRAGFWVLLAWLALGGSVPARGADAVADAGSAPDAARVQQRMDSLTVPFEANTGQEDERVAFTARTFAATLFVTRAGQLVHSFPGLPPAEIERAFARKAMQRRGPGWVLTESFVNAHPVVHGGAESATRVSRFVGRDPTRWQSSAPTYDRISLGEAWPGVEVELAAHGNNVEKLFTVAPGADARRIAIRLRGARSLELAADGALVANTGNGPVSFTAPVAWQDIDGARHSVRVAYELAGCRYGFQLGDYNPAYPVVIDPLLQATYLGGSSGEHAYAIALDGSYNVFVAGEARSTDFPGTTGGAQPAYGGGGDDAFVARLNNGLSAITQATYLGGGDDDIAYAVAVDGSNNVFVVGQTRSTDFPGTSGGAQASNNGGGLITFVAKLTNNLKTLTQATYLGDNWNDYGFAIALQGSTSVFVAGYAGVAKLTNNLKTLTRATSLGGSVGFAQANAIGLDGSGNVFVAGYTSSTDLPGTSGGAQPSKNSSYYTGFVAKLNNGLTTLTQATYLGGTGSPSGGDWVASIALQGSTDVFVAGGTHSADLPGTAGGAQTSNKSTTYASAFVAKLTNNLRTLTRATYLGGTGGVPTWGIYVPIVLDGSNNVFVAGTTRSSDFPGTSGGVQPTNSNGGLGAAYVARLTNDLKTLTQATYLRGSGGEYATAIAAQGSTSVFVVGETYSADFPGTSGGAQTTVYSARSGNGFIAKLTPDLAAVAPASPTKLAITSVNGGASPAAGVGFSVVVQAQDNTSTARSVLASTAVTLSRHAGTGALGGTLTCTLSPGSSSCTVSAATYSKAEAGVSLMATRTSGETLAPGNSAPFTVNRPGHLRRVLARKP